MLLTAKSNELKTRRSKAGLSRYKLAQKADLPLTAIYRIEDGTTKRVNSWRAEAIAHALGCKTSDLFTENKEGA